MVLHTRLAQELGIPADNTFAIEDGQVIEKMKARLERGYWCFHPPAGYEYKKDKEHGKIIVPNQLITDILAEGLFAFSENLLLGQVDFLKFLHSKNYPKLLKIKKLTFQHVKQLLTQPLYAGIIEYPSWEITRRRGLHKAIITEDTYDKIQYKLKQPERKPRETDNTDFSLRRVISCSVCSKKMTGSVSKGKCKYYAYYTCNNKSCSANPKNIASEKMEQDYISLLKSITVEQEILEMGKLVATRMWEQKVKDVSASKEFKETERKELEKTIDEYIDLIPKTNSESIRARYEMKIDELDMKIKELKNKPENKKAPDMNEALSLIFKFIGTPAETWKKPDRNLKIMVHNMIFTENPIYSFQKGFGTPKLSLPFSIKDYIFDHHDDQNDELVVYS